MYGNYPAGIISPKYRHPAYSLYDGIRDSISLLEEAGTAALFLFWAKYGPGVVNIVIRGTT